jgi:AcrR family transcriptional regulator
VLPRGRSRRAATEGRDIASAPAPSRTRWAGVPQSERQAERRALLLATAFDLLGTEGWTATTVRAVCQAARLNPRYFYESFADLDELLVAVYDDVTAQLAERVLQALGAAGPDPHRRVRVSIDTIFRFVTEDPRRARILYTEALGNEPLAERRIETVRAVTQFVQAYGADDRLSAPAASERGAAADPIGAMGASWLVGGLGEILVAWLDGRIAVTLDELIDGATALVVGTGEAVSAMVGRRVTAL